MNTKVSVVIIIVAFLIGVGVGVIISGNNENTNTVSIPEFEKFIGTWTGVEVVQIGNSNVTFDSTWIFYGNHSVHIDVYAHNETSSDNRSMWRIFEIFEGKLKITLRDIPPVFYQYEFSKDGKQLTLINPKGTPLVLTKIE